jgi:NTE family protein
MAFAAPDVLVLAGGGVVGESWMNGVLAGLQEATGFDARGAEAFVGTSAGSIVAARLASGRAPRRPTDATPPAPANGDDDHSGDGALRTALRWGWAATAPLAPAAVALATPGGALARSALLARSPHQGRSLQRLHAYLERAGARFDGRLRVCCVDRASGRRVVFGAPGAPAASVADAVTCSCAIPWVFAPVRIGERDYVDGGVWSVTNLDAAPTGRDTQVLCLNPTTALRSSMRHAFRAATAVERQLLRGRGTRVLEVGPDTGAVAAMGSNLMDEGRAAPALQAGYAQGLSLA